MWHWLQWVGTVAVWVTFAYQIRQIVHRYRRGKQEHTLLVARIAHEEDLTPLQIQVAMDAASAVFVSRVEEMRRANRQQH